MINFIKKHLLIILILLIAITVRFYKIGSFPALNADEAAIGYNVYSIIQTGRDEHGNLWPLHFESFGDYKPGVYFYLTTPFIYIFGLNELAVRFPGVFLGVASVYVIYILLNELFTKQQKVSIFGCRLSIGEVGALILAISPWHIHFSRGAWEVNVATFFITLGFYFFIKSLKKPTFFNIAIFILSFVISLYTYHSARMIVPILGVGSFLIYRKKIVKNIKPFFICSLFGLILLIPLIKEMTSPVGLSRASGVSIFSDPGVIARIDEQRNKFENSRGFWARFFHNKPVNYSIEFFENWSQHYSPNFLFLVGDEIQRNKVPGMGQLYILDAVWLTVGFWWLARKLKRKNNKFILMWLVVAPMAAALTFQSPHALRAQNMIIPLTIISSIGLFTVLSWLKNQKKYLVLTGITVLIILIFWQFARYQYSYWFNMAKIYPYSSQYGIKELVNYVAVNRDEYENILVTNRYDQPYILFLFYLKYPPQEFQVNHELTPRDKYGFSTVVSFDKYIFKKINLNDDRFDYPNSLIAGTDEEIPYGVDVVKEIYGINGYKYFDLVVN